MIVSLAGGTWWRRVWRTRTMPTDAVCTWCGRPPSEVSKLIAGPNVYICDTTVFGCVGRFWTGGGRSGKMTGDARTAKEARMRVDGITAPAFRPSPAPRRGPARSL